MSGADDPEIAERFTPLLFASVPGNEGETEGGVFAVGETACELLDPVPTTGMAISADRSRLARLTWSRDRLTTTELLISDLDGLLIYRRLDEVGEPHSLLWYHDELFAVSTRSNSVAVLTSDGTTTRTIRPPGAPEHGDCWHLNSLVVVDGRVHASAFGRFGTTRGWSTAGALSGAGIVLDAESGEELLSGLAAPHDPTWVDGTWVVCNSYTGEVLRLAHDGRRIGAVDLGGWTRGVFVDAGRIFVGVSAHRLAPPMERAHIAVLDRGSLREIGRIALPARDVFALCPYDELLARGLRSGARLGSLRQLGSHAIVMDDPLSPTDSLVRIELVSAITSIATVRVTNLSSAILSSVGRYPVRIGVRRWDAPGARWVDAGRSDFGAPLYPQSQAVVEVDIPPASPGEPVRIAVVQEMVRWFDEVDPSALVDVVG